MKVAIIAPNNYLTFSDQGDFYFVLAQRLENEQYRSFFTKRKEKHTMLDNGAFEFGKSISTDTLLDYASLIQPNEIVAPDYPMYGEESLRMTKDFLSVCPKNLKVVAIPHGKDVLDLVGSYKEVTKLDVDVIGFSVVFHKHTGFRPLVFHFLKKNHIFDTTKKHHLFGLDSLTELWCYDNSIRSVDCSLPISCAYNDTDLPMFDSPVHRSRVPEDAKLNHLQKHMCNVYIQRLLTVAKRI